MRHTWIVIALCAAGATAHAQEAGAGSGSDAGSAAPVSPYDEAPPPTTTSPPPAVTPAPASEPPPKPEPPRKPDPELAMPMLISTPTGFLLPAAVLYSRTGLDTSGGFVTDERVGLGDVAEFGLSTLDDIRAKQAKADSLSAIQPYVAATFRMGVAEDRLFAYQPGLVLGFRKSFARTDDGVTSRVAELTLVASKHLGSRAAIHLGYAFWDASLDGDTNNTALHDRPTHSLIDQLRPFGGIEVRPFARSAILADVAWAPEFCYACTTVADQIRMSAELSWGVRYQATPWLYLESGVHVFDIEQARLLDAQIYGQVTFVSWGLRHVVDSIR